MTNGKRGPGGYADPIKEAWAIRFKLRKYMKYPSKMPASLCNQLSHCKTDECRRIILGKSK